MPPEYTVEVTVSRIGPRAFEIAAAQPALPSRMPQDMADWLLREHGIDAVERGADVVPTADWPPSGGGGGD